MEKLRSKSKSLGFADLADFDIDDDDDDDYSSPIDDVDELEQLFVTVSTISERAPAMAQHLNDALDIPVREKLSELMQRAQKEAAEKAGAAAG